MVFGATGFAGRLVAEPLAAYAPRGTRVGLAGRSCDRLAAVRGRLGGLAADWPLVVAGSGGQASLRRMAERARVVATTVGPYAAHGLLLVTLDVAPAPRARRARR